jgi:hypothetical protein
MFAGPIVCPTIQFGRQPAMQHLLLLLLLLLPAD